MSEKKSERITVGWLATAVMLMAACRPGTPALTIEAAWVRPAPPGAHASAGYMTIRNNSDNDIRVSRITSDAFGRVELHETKMNEGEMQMRRLGEVVIPASGEMRLQPGKMHLMLFEPKTDLQNTAEVRLILFDGDTPLAELTTIVSRGNPYE